jgi:hypothetical protein
MKIEHNKVRRGKMSSKFVVKKTGYEDIDNHLLDTYFLLEQGELQNLKN